MCILQRVGEHHREAEKTLDKVVNTLNDCIDHIQGCRGIYELSHSDMHNSSVVCLMNSGHKKIAKYYEEANTFLKYLSRRQNWHCIEMNVLLFNGVNLFFCEEQGIVPSNIVTHQIT